MRAAIAAAEVGDEQRREDPTVNELEAAAAELLGQEEAVFVPTATMANEIALRMLGRAGRRGGRRAELAHLHLRARRPGRARRPDDAAAALRGRPLHARAAARDRAPTRRHAHAARRGSSRSRTRTTPRAGASGRSRSSTRSSRRRASSSCAVHLDGARVLNAAVALGVPAAEIGRPLRHGHALPLEGSRLPARRARSPARRS